MGHDWNASLCGCFDDCESCMCSYFCPCVQFGRNMEAAGLGENCACCCGFCVLGGLSWILGCVKRGEMREKFNIEGSGCEDCCYWFFLPFCALSQEARELKSRGIGEHSRLKK